MERREGERRHNQTSILAERDLKTERRQANRRRLVQAGMLALMGAAGAKAHLLTRTHLLSDPAEVSVDVSEGGFRLQVPEYDRAMLETFANEAAQVYGVSADLVLAVIQTESGFRPEAVSPVGAQGPMQLMPTTAKALGIEDPQDARQNIFGGTKYLSKLLYRFNGNVALALASYNAGPTVVARHKGIPPYGETRGYVSKIHKLLADTDAAFAMPVPKARARGRAVLKSRTVMVRVGLKDRRARVSQAVSVSRKPVRSSKARAIAVKYKAPARGGRASGARV
jgi:soluble lytic murein transglycosylase-like protein